MPRFIFKKKKKKHFSPYPNVIDKITKDRREEKRRKRLESGGLVHEGLEISNEIEFDDVNESEVNEPPNATLRDFDNYPMDDSGHVVSNIVENVVYDDQPYFEKPSQDNKNFGHDV